MIAMRKSQPSLLIKNPKKTPYNIKNEKRSQIRSARELIHSSINKLSVAYLQKLLIEFYQI